MATKGTEDCNIGKDPMDIQCGQNMKTTDMNQQYGSYPYERVKQYKIEYFDKLLRKFNISNLHDFALEFIKSEITENGVIFHVDKSYFNSKNNDTDKSIEAEYENEIFESNFDDYAKGNISLYSYLYPMDGREYHNFGESLHVSDLDNDGLDDLIIGAPGKFRIFFLCTFFQKYVFVYFLGFQVPGNRNQGRIYIKYSLEQFDIHFDQEISLSQGGYEYQRFGHSIATLGKNFCVM